MAKISINKDRCKGCFLCVGFCPKGSIKKSKALNKLGVNFVEFIDKNECIGCMICGIICPECCIEVWK